MNMFYREAESMKSRRIRKVEFKGAAEVEGFSAVFQIQVLRTLAQRRVLTELECEKGIALLKEKRR
jgi:hypothetical protein